MKPELFIMDSPGVNCVDRHKEKESSRVALSWEKEPAAQEERVTYGTSRKKVWPSGNLNASALSTHCRLNARFYVPVSEPSIP